MFSELLGVLMAIRDGFVVNKVTQPGHNLVIAGDFNCGDVDWDASTVKPDAYDRAPNKKLLDLVNNCSLTNVQQQATRRGRAPVEPNNLICICQRRQNSCTKIG